MDVPEKYKTAGLLMLIAGGINIALWGLVTFALFLLITLYAIGSLGLAIPAYCCCIVPLAATAFGGYEAFVGFQVMNGTVVKHANVVSIIGIIVGALALPSSSLLSAIPLILEIIATVNLQDTEVTNWIANQDPELLT